MRWSIAGSFLIALFLSPQACAQEITKEVLLREAPKAWATMEDAAFRGRVVLRRSDPNGVSTIRCEFLGDKARFDKSGRENCTLYTREHPLPATRKSRDAPFGWNMLNQEVYEHLRAPFSVYGVPMRELLADPEFKISRVSEQPDGKVKVEFIYDGEHVGEPRKFYSNGWCIVDPKRSWAVTSVFIENPKYRVAPDKPEWHPKMSFVVEYADGDAEIPKLLRNRSLKPDGTDAIVTEILHADDGPVSPERFSPFRMGFPGNLMAAYDSNAIRWVFAALLAVAVAYWARRRYLKSKGPDASHAQ